LDHPSIDELPPGARLAVRVLAAGGSPQRVAELIGDDRSAVRKHLRVAAHAWGVTLPPAGASDDELLAALEPVLAAARSAPGKAPSTRCPAGDVLAALAGGALDGPLLLAALDHVADCASCLGQVLTPPAAPADVPQAERRGGCLGLLLLAAAAGTALTAL